MFLKLTNDVDEKVLVNMSLVETIVGKSDHTNLHFNQGFAHVKETPDQILEMLVKSTFIIPAGGTV